jgi:ribosomal protein S18 acetylase RimI-like enzyme
VVAIVDRAFEVYIPAIGQRPRPMTADYAAWIADGVVDVVEVGGAVVGAVVHWPEGADQYVEVVAVHPDQQGTGLGAHLLDHVAARGLAGGRDAVRLQTNEAMVDSLEWYLRHGFEEVGRLEVQGFHRIELVRRGLQPGA